MDTKAFEAALQRDGYGEVSTRVIEPGVHNASHAHPFDVRALMLSGELTLSWEGQTRTYRAGEVFAMAAGCAHVEQFGPAGASYVVGRRQPADG
jgi:quercetin dioxygenase-like cupin family protein